MNNAYARMFSTFKRLHTQDGTTMEGAETPNTQTLKEKVENHNPGMSYDEVVSALKKDIQDFEQDSQTYLDSLRPKLPKDVDPEAYAEALEVLEEKPNLEIAFDDLYEMILFEKHISERGRK